MNLVKRSSILRKNILMCNYIIQILIVTFFSFALSACSKPYGSSEIFEDGQHSTNPFFGLRDIVRQDGAKVIWVHGMCSHNKQWAKKRHDRLVSITNATRLSKPYGTLVTSSNGAYRVEYKDVVEGQLLETRYLVWSPLTMKAKQPLEIDTSGEVIQARINKSLKKNLMNDCLADAVAYLGKPGDEIRRWMKGEVCNILGGHISSSDRCNLSRQYNKKPVLLVSESLGSIMLSDAANAIWDETSKSKKEELASRLSDVQMMFLIANQIPLLKVANYDRNSIRSTADQNIPELVQLLSKARRLNQAYDTSNKRGSLRVVEFTDPNDLLSYRLEKSINYPKDVLLTNVTVSNAYTYFGLLENPIDAHCGYAWNKYVLRIIVDGYDGQKTKPIGVNVKKNSCLK